MAKSQDDCKLPELGNFQGSEASSGGDSEFRVVTQQHQDQNFPAHVSSSYLPAQA